MPSCETCSNWNASRRAAGRHTSRAPACKIGVSSSRGQADELKVAWEAGVVELVLEKRTEHIKQGSHICQLYNKPREMLDIAVALLSQGLSGKDRCFYFGAPESVPQLRADLAQLCDVEDAQRRGQLLLGDQREEFVPDGRFDPYAMLAHHQSLVAKAVRDGWEGVRGAIDMSWVAAGLATPAQILKYEALSDAVFTFQNQPIVVFVQYNYAKLAGEMVVELLKLHPLAVVGKFMKRNPYYVNSEEYFRKIVKLEGERGQIAV